VCDYERCCDGSEEWDKVGGISCPDKCKEIGKEWRKLDDARQKSMTAALRKKNEYALDATRMKKEVEEKISVLKKQIEGQEVAVKDLEAKLVDAERKAKGKVVKTSGSGGKLAVLVGLAKDRVEELRNNLVTVRVQRNAVNDRLKELEQIMTTFKEEYNPNFNDEGVKRAVRSWEDYVAKDKAGEIEEGTEKDLDEITKPDTDTEGLKWADYQSDGQDDTDLCKCYMV
jgi:protein kinase C substrate 80K-H